MTHSGHFDHESHDSRSRWPYPAMLPHSIKAYPIVQLAPEIGPQRPADFPPRMPIALAEWREATSHYPNHGSQIYLHIPFCPFLCHFCPLYKVKKSEDRTLDKKELFVRALIREIELYAKIPSAAGQPYNAIYFGGGTPTELSPEQLGRILGALRRHFQVTPDAEITLEGVAKQMLAPGYVEQALKLGFNRFSFGVQSLDVTHRRRIGRGDGVDDYPALIELVRKLAPEANVNCEIMANMPEQTFESFQSDVGELIRWGTNSVDILYYVHMPGTQLYNFVSADRRGGPEYGGRLMEFRKFTNQTFRRHGYAQVTGEVFVRDERDLFVHTSFGGGGNGLNALLALGPSGFGQLNGTVYQNLCDNVAYIEAVDSGLLPVARAETMTVETAERRALLLSLLRLEIPDFLVKGIRTRRLVGKWKEMGLIKHDVGRYRLTDRGLLWYNHMQVESLPVFELLRVLRMFGSIEDQTKAFSRREEEMGSQEREVLEIVRSQFGSSRLGKLAHMATLKLHDLPFFDRRAVGFTGPIEPRQRTS